MADKTLRDTIDIHGGGQDLSNPHHENEIAQKWVKTGKKFLRTIDDTRLDDGRREWANFGNSCLFGDLILTTRPQVLLRFFLAVRTIVVH